MFVNNKEFIDLRKIICFEKMCVLGFSKLALVCISYHCRNGMTSYCVL